jgi:hypothetical protein
VRIGLIPAEGHVHILGAHECAPSVAVWCACVRVPFVQLVSLSASALTVLAHTKEKASYKGSL